MIHFTYNKKVFYMTRRREVTSLYAIHLLLKTEISDFLKIKIQLFLSSSVYLIIVQ